MAAFHSASISASVASARRLAARGERILDRRKAPLEFQVGRAQRGLGIDIEMAREIDHREQQIADLGFDLVGACRSSSASISSVSSRIFASTAFGSFQSKPTLPAFCCSLSARVSAGSPADTPDSAPSRRETVSGAGGPPASAFAALSCALIASHWTLTSPVLRPRLSPNTCGWRRISFSVIACTTSPKCERALLLGHAGVEHDLQQQVAELVLQVIEIAAADRVGDLVGFLDGVGRDGREILLQVPRTAGAGRAQRRHDLDETRDVGGRFHGRAIQGKGG